MPLSNRPQARSRQLQNLRRGETAIPGNRNAQQHGGYASIATEQLQAKEREVFLALNEDLPLREPDGSAPAADAVAVSLLAQALCRLDSVRSYLQRRGIEDGKGRLRPAVEVEGRLRREALDFAEALGLTPRSRARIGLDLVRAAGAREGSLEDFRSGGTGAPTLDAEAVDASEDGPA
jgi:hypothetical protein